MQRRKFLTTALTPALAPALAQAAKGRTPKILVRSSWQVVNIGDIAHSPGVLTLLEKHIPNAEVTLWPSSLANGVEAMIRRRFPKLKIVLTPDEIKHAIDSNDFLLHGSGPFLVAVDDVDRWRATTSKPYGVYGITFPKERATPKVVDTLNGARFVFFRDSVSLATARAAGVKAPVMEFAPDGAFATDLRNDEAANAFLREHALEPGKFLCCIPRFRMTPDWLMLSRKRPYDAERDKRNLAMKEHDHAPLCEAITRVVREAHLRILICPEDETQVALGKEILYDKLPEDVKPSVVWRDHFWLTDEALSTYRQSAGLFGNEMHSPIMCIGHGIPAIVCRFEEQTSKGFMWRDIGLNDWLFDLDVEIDLPKIAPAVLAMAKYPVAARRKALKARSVVLARQKATMQLLRRQIS